MERCLQRGAAGSGRSDDNVESLKKRFQTYVGDTMPIIEHYEALGLVRKIDASQSPDEVFEEVKKKFEWTTVRMISRFKIPVTSLFISTIRVITDMEPA